MKSIVMLLSGVLVGAVGMFVYASMDAPKPQAMVASRSTAMAPALSLMPTAAATQPKPSASETPAAKPASAPAPAPADAAIADAAVPLADQLLIPVAGITASALQDTYDDGRSPERRHEAIDLLAPKGTPVFAVADGTIAKLFHSKPGGLTIYHFDSSQKYAYYYAHLDRYADGVKEGMTLKRGDLIGYVGTSGNADPQTPHLHFAVFVLGPEKKWWKGSPVNPYPLLGGAPRH